MRPSARKKQMPLLSLPYTEAEARLRGNREHGRWWFADHLAPELRALGASERLKEPVFAPLIKPSFYFTGRETLFTIGSCFAREIEEAMNADGIDVSSHPEIFNQWEPKVPAAVSGTDERIYRMGVVNKYTIRTMVEELRWAAQAAPVEDHPAIQEIASGRFVDLAAHNILAGEDKASVQRRRQEINRLMRGAYTSDLIVVTLGLAEGWRDTETGISLVDSPISFKSENTGRYVLDVLSYADHINGLREIAALLNAHGKPGWRMLLTVSPVPFLASYTGDDVIIANSYSKAVLRAAAEEFARENERVDYFPSFEMANYSDPALVWESDRRHVTRPFVGEIISAFKQAYLKS